MFRRKTRNLTAYTGVGYAGPLAQAPNNTAMAAALTIGQNLKQSQPDIYGNPNTRTNSTSQPQPERPSQTQVKGSGSLLKRSSLIQQGISGKTRNVSSSKPNYARTGLNLSQTRHFSQNMEHPHIYSVDDSFNDSFFEEVGQETDAHYSNEAQLRDLRLHHRPPTALAPAPAIKMVKKYIPTPNGITVVEVPEELLKKEIAHTNSMRSKPSGPRMGLMRGNRSHSFTNATKAKQGNRLRLSSLASTPRIDENIELDLQRQQNELTELNYQRQQKELAELNHQRQQNELANLEIQRKQIELAELQRQIDHERRMAHELEKQRREYEQLWQLRAENERKLRELQTLQEQDSDSLRDVSSFEDRAPLSNGTVATSSVNEKSYMIEEEDEEEDHRAESQSVEEDVPIKALSFVVDELDLKKINGDSHINGEAVETIIELNRESPSPHDAIIDSYVESSPPYNDVDVRHLQVFVDDFGIEEIAPANFDSPNLATQLRPTFVQNSVESSPQRNNMTQKLEADCSDREKHESGPLFNPVQEIIGTQNLHSPDLEAAIVPDTVVVPPALASSIRSSSSLDSKLKPIKSAMKNSRMAYSQSNSSSDNPAHQAYLSLTTAENTRLNSKLLAPKLHEGLLPEPKSPHSPSRRMSQSLRKQPSAANQGGLAGRSLRPQSTIESNGAARTQPGGMSSRNLKGFSLSNNQPIAPHPMTKANYKSPLKIKAAELYAKANKRPISEFQVRQRKSSFSRESDLEERADGDAGVPLRSRHRMTLRAPVSVSNPQQQATAPVQQNAHSKNSIQPQAHVSRGISLRYGDSDDESGPATVQTSTKFLSRFADSDDEGPAPQISSGNRVQDASMKSLRNKEEAEPGKKVKEKKPKKKFLKKLFGRN